MKLDPKAINNALTLAKKVATKIDPGFGGVKPAVPGVGVPLLRKSGGRAGFAAGGSPDPSMAPDFADSLYSHGQRVAETLPPTAQPEQMRSMLQQNGVKGSEMKWSGVNDDLSHPGELSSPDVARAFSMNMAYPEERMLRDLPSGSFQKMRRRHKDEEDHAIATTRGSIDERREAIRELRRRHQIELRNLENIDPTYHGYYTLPGGNNYREILLQHPTSASGEADYSNRDHFGGEPNIIASLRMKDRIDEGTGAPIAHLEELQSDWGQAARHGYQGQPEKTAARDALKAFEEELKSNHASVTDKPFEPLFSALMQDKGKEHDSLRYAAAREQQAMESRPKGPAPFIDKTEDWAGLGLKRALFEAAHGGHDKLAWTPGEDQYARFSDPREPEKTRAQRLAGMKSFYDQMLPKRLLQIARQHDPEAHLTTAAVKVPYGEYDGSPPEMKSLPALRITDRMRESIKKNGFPMYQRGGAVDGYAGGGSTGGDESPSAYLEVAPGGSYDAEQKRRWEMLHPVVKSAISEKMLQEFLPKWEKQTGITGDVLPGLGGFMGDTNPNYAYRPHNPEHISKALNGLGSLLRQDAMMGASSRPFEGSAPKGIVRVHIPKEMHPDKIHNLYRILHEQGLAEGHSTDLRNGTMDIMHDSHPAAIKAGIKIHSLLGGQHDVETFPTHISFPSHGVDYDTVPSGREPSEPSAQAPSNPLQAEAAERLQQHIDAAHAGGGAQVRPPEHSNRGGTTPEVQDAEEGEDHPAWIDQRIPSTKNRAKSDPDERRRVDVPALRQSPKLFEKNVNLFRNYVNTPKSIADKATTEELLEHSTNHMVQNLLALHDAVPEDVRNRSRLWYDGSNAIARRMAQDHDIPVHAAAGVLAALSPQKDWYQNVSLADRILKLHKGGENYYYGRTMTPEMERAFHSIGAFKKPIYQEMFRSLQGKSLGDLDKDKRLDPEERARMKALWTRIHDEAHGDKSYQVVSPEGEYIGAAKNANGEDKKAGWGSTTEMAKAIQVLENMHDPDKISGLMGEKHKVRNFYNNILSPNSRHGDVTIDTHAVAAALYRALSGKSEEVAHNFGGGIAGKPGSGGSAITGIHGTYPIFADAYRRAAEARGILPREMQSITWEAIRGLFPAKFKSQKKNVKAVDDVWRQHRNGSIPSNIARDKINELAGGINNPTWLGGDNQVDEEDEDPGHETEFSGSGVHGQPAQAHDAGTEGPAPAPVALGQALKSTPQYKSGGSINHALSIAKTSRYR